MYKEFEKTFDSEQEAKYALIDFFEARKEDSSADYDVDSILRKVGRVNPDGTMQLDFEDEGHFFMITESSVF